MEEMKEDHDSWRKIIWGIVMGIAVLGWIIFSAVYSRSGKTIYWLEMLKVLIVCLWFLLPTIHSLKKPEKSVEEEMFEEDGDIKGLSMKDKLLRTLNILLTIVMIGLTMYSSRYKLMDLPIAVKQDYKEMTVYVVAISSENMRTNTINIWYMDHPDGDWMESSRCVWAYPEIEGLKEGDWITIYFLPYSDHVMKVEKI